MRLGNSELNPTSTRVKTPGSLKRAVNCNFRLRLQKALSRLGVLQFYARAFKLEVPPELYTKEYFLSNSGCEGSKEFKESHGERLSSRLLTILTQIKNVDGNAFLDLGCGRGEILLQMENRAGKLVGIDYGASAVELCRGVTKKAKVIQADIVRFLPEFESDPFDGVLMIDIAEHLFDWQLEIVFKHVARLLKADGHLYIDAPLIPVRPYSDMHVNIKEDAEQYLKFLPEFRIENVVLVDPVGSNHLITMCKSKQEDLPA
jgi:SAM-dependent methyltransferase